MVELQKRYSLSQFSVRGGKVSVSTQCSADWAVYPSLPPPLESALQRRCVRVSSCRVTACHVPMPSSPPPHKPSPWSTRSDPPPRLSLPDPESPSYPTALPPHWTSGPLTTLYSIYYTYLALLFDSKPYLLIRTHTQVQCLYGWTPD